MDVDGFITFGQSQVGEEAVVGANAGNEIRFHAGQVEG